MIRKEDTNQDDIHGSTDPTDRTCKEVKKKRLTWEWPRNIRGKAPFLTEISDYKNWCLDDVDARWENVVVNFGKPASVRPHMRTRRRIPRKGGLVRPTNCSDATSWI